MPFGSGCSWLTNAPGTRRKNRNTPLKRLRLPQVQLRLAVQLFPPASRLLKHGDEKREPRARKLKLFREKLKPLTGKLEPFEGNRQAAPGGQSQLQPQHAIMEKWRAIGLKWDAMTRKRRAILTGSAVNTPLSFGNAPLPGDGESWGSRNRLRRANKRTWRATVANPSLGSKPARSADFEPSSF